MPSFRASRAFLLFLLLALTFVAYQPGLYGDFEFDDFSNIVDNPKLVVSEVSLQSLSEAAFSSYSGMLKRPISMLSFAWNASTTGISQPLYFKLTNLLIHLGNGLLVYVFIGQLLRRLRETGAAIDTGAGSWIQLAVAGMWLLHPINLTSVLYVVQRMTSLSATFALLACVLYMIGRERVRAGAPRGWTILLSGLLFGGALSALAKENGVLVPVMLAVVEFVFFGITAARARDIKLVRLLFLVTVLLPALAFVYQTIIDSPRLYSSYQVRDFGMLERILTQPVVLLFYVRLIFLPSVSSFGLFHDDFPVAEGLFQPPLTAVAVAAVAGLASLGFAVAKRLPALSFGLLWFLAGHLLESTTLPLEMVHEHRNYLPSVGLLFAAAYYICIPGIIPDTVKLRRMAILMFGALFCVVTALRAEQWGSLTYHAIAEAQNHPNSERANQQLGRIMFLLYVDTGNSGYYQGALDALNRARRAKSISVVSHTTLMQLYAYAKQPVDPTLIPEFASRLENQPLAPSVVPSIRALVDCQMFAYCAYPDSVVVNLIEAALRNPRGQVGITTSLRIYLAQYYIDKMGDVVGSINALESARDKAPKNIDVNLNLARIYRVMKQFEYAEKYLAESAKLDNLGNRGSDIQVEREKLDRDKLQFRQDGPRKQG